MSSWDKRLFSSRVLAVLAIPVFVLLITIAALALRLSQDEMASQSFVDHTYKVIVAADDVLADVQSAQIAERGYQMGGAPQSLAAAEADLKAAPRDLERLRTLTVDNPHQQTRIAELKPLLNALGRDVEREVAVVESAPRPAGQGVDEARLRALVRDALGQVEEVRAVLKEAVAEEDNLLARRTAETRGLERSTLVTALIGALFALALIGAAALLLLRSNSRLAQSEAARTRQATILQATLDSIHDGIAVFESDMTLAAFNPNFFALADFPQALARIGTPLARFRAAEENRKDRLFPHETLAEERGRGTRNLVVSNRNLEVYATAVPNAGALVAVADITQRVRSEETLRQAQKMEAIGHLTGGVAHDFNNLLQVISANLDLAEQETESNSRLAGRLKNASAAVDRGARLTTQLLAFARRQALEPRAINPGRLVQEMTDMLRRSLGEQVEIEAIVAGGLWNTFVDPHQVQNAILNLAINARDAMPAGGKLTIEVSNAFLDDDYAAQHADVGAGQYVLIAVSDTGTGMTPDVMSRAFEPFFTTKGEGQGTGLGLSQVYGFVKQSGGHVKIYSEPGEGTTVKIYLPRTKGVQEAAAPTADAPLEGGHETILVVEDDEDVRQAVADMLKDLGYTVIEADDAEAALVVLHGDVAIDLLFSDVVMPGPIPTRELAHKARERRPEIKILFTSGYTQNAIVHNGRLDDGVFLLSKPYRKQDLARKLRSLLAEPAGAGKSAPTLSEGSASAKHSTPRKALVVDDVALVRMSTADMVGEIGLAAAEAGSGQEALDILAKDKEIDVLVTDLGLPGMTGAELIREARRRNPALSIVVISGYSRNIAPEAGIPPDANFLTKPFDVTQLRGAIFRS
jgi:signal transduction histidine kinase/DNA-binding response OmpR family regulator